MEKISKLFDIKRMHKLMFIAPQTLHTFILRIPTDKFNFKRIKFNW